MAELYTLQAPHEDVKPEPHTTSSLRVVTIYGLGRAIIAMKSFVLGGRDLKRPEYNIMTHLKDHVSRIITRWLEPSSSLALKKLETDRLAGFEPKARDDPLSRLARGQHYAITDIQLLGQPEKPYGIPGISMGVLLEHSLSRS